MSDQEANRFKHSKKCSHHRQALPRVDEADSETQSPPGKGDT